MIAIRSEREIALLRAANQVVAAVHAALEPLVQPGVSTAELDAVADAIIAEHGGEAAFKGYHGYPAATCISIEQEVVHGIPRRRRRQCSGRRSGWATRSRSGRMSATRSFLHG